MFNNFRSRPTASWLYWFATAGLGTALLALSCYEVFREGSDPRWPALAGLTAIVAFFTFKIPGINSKISVADTFVLMNLIFFGPAAGYIAAALEALAGSVLSTTRSRRWEFTLFNMGNGTICAYLAGLIYLVVLGRGPLVHHPETGFAALFPAAVVLALSYYLLNSGTVALMVALEARKSVFRIWEENFLWHSVNYFSCTSAAVFIIVNGGLISPLTLMAAGFVVMAVYEAHRVILGRLAVPGNR